jgi:hypothetical protein
MNETDPLEIIRAKRKELGTKEVAAALECADSTIRALCSPKGYPGDPAKLYARARRLWIDVIRCPFIDEDIPARQCRERALGPEPFGNPVSRRWWLACQDCPLKPAGGGDDK